MSEVLLKALSTLYHDPDPEAKKQASQFLEEWRLESEAWSVAVSTLHSAINNVEVVLFCAQTLVFKIQQDFEELSESEVLQLRESLVELLMKYGSENGIEIAKTQLALAIAAFCAHVPANIWAPMNCIQWLAERLCQENDTTSASCLLSLLVIIPEEARNHRIGLHPKRRDQFITELENGFQDVIHILHTCQETGLRGDILSAMANWIYLCKLSMLQSHGAKLGSFVQLAVDSLDDSTNFMSAVEFLSELLYVTAGTTDIPDLNNLAKYVALAIVKFQPVLCQSDTDDERLSGLARLFCDIGTNHENLLLLDCETSTALIDGLIAVTSHPDEEVNIHCFDFWERTAPRVAMLIKQGQISAERASYFVSVFERLMSVLLDLAKLPEDYMELSLSERSDVNRRSLRICMTDAVGVIGPQRSLETLINALSAESQLGEQNWRRTESLLFALDSVADKCRKSKAEMTGALFHALGSVPNSLVIQSTMCDCLSSYASWLPTLVEQTGTDPFSLLLPAIFRNMSLPEWAPPAVDAFVQLCKFCRSHLPMHAAEFLELHQRVSSAANAFHQWIDAESAAFIMKEAEATEVIGAMCNGMSRADNHDVAIQFIYQIAEETLTDIANAATQAHVSVDQAERRLVILVTRLKTLFKNCVLEQIASQLLDRVCPDLLQMAGAAPSSENLTEEICSCLRYALKSSGISSGDRAMALAAALPTLFASNSHCGYLYVASEIAKIFGRSVEHAPTVYCLVYEMLGVVSGILQTPNDFHDKPDLADDAFLMAGRILNYCPDALLTQPDLLIGIIDTAVKGVLVQHEDACRSVLRFLSDLATVDHHVEDVHSALLHRGAALTQFLLAAVAGALPLRVLDDVSQTLASILLRSDSEGVSWVVQIIDRLPDQVLSANEKTSFIQNLTSSDLQKSERGYLRVTNDLADICRRSRIVRQAAQTTLLQDA